MNPNRQEPAPARRRFLRVGAAGFAALSATLRDAIARPALPATFAQASMTAVSSSPAALSARIATEQRCWKPVITANDIRAD